MVAKLLKPYLPFEFSLAIKMVSPLAIMFFTHSVCLLIVGKFPCNCAGRQCRLRSSVGILRLVMDVLNAAVRSAAYEATYNHRHTYHVSSARHDREIGVVSSSFSFLLQYHIQVMLEPTGYHDLIVS